MSTSAQSRADLVRHSAYEFALTTVLLFAVVSLIRWLALPGSPLAIGDPQTLFAVAGVAVAALIAGLMYSPPGRRSGGHMHPGVTVFLWSSGLFPARAVLPYVAAQLAGSVAGTALAGLVWGGAVRQVGHGAVHPAPGTGAVELFLIEGAALAAVFVAVALVMTRPALGALIPAAIGVGVGVVIATLGTVTGASINPARAFGPALLSGAYEHFWNYMIAPVVAPALVGLAHRALRTRRSTAAAATPAEA
ncbi:aquaporin [Streptomyces hirsutus]|uniref:Aquaporin n=1 Tax=Streptomyces hirsutus TaxID=35620 RepID=A0ABZ1GVK0_9ACTN|nr:aquaporin [Streptomyces hirsutus]WSD10258.1 aquaporin [Streptomyces hirsutus]WTD16394.1 aquaporin [Streptomyces hirsutus]